MAFMLGPEVDDTLNYSPYGYGEFNIVVGPIADKMMPNLFKQLENRDPDHHAMYIYNDFFSYGVLDLLQEVVTDIYKAINGKKKDFVKAFHHVEAFVTLASIADDWHNVDDGDRMMEFKQCAEAAIYHTFEGLRADNMLNNDTFPNCANILIASFGFSEQYDVQGESSLWKYINKTWRTEFAPKTDADLAAWDAAMNAKRMEHESPAVVENDEGDEDEEDEEDRVEAIEKMIRAHNGWRDRAIAYNAASDKDNEDYKKRDFQCTSRWANYRRDYCGATPFYGEDSFDITTWTDAQRAKYSFERFESIAAGLPSAA